MAHHGDVLVFPALVRARVLEQHADLRELIGSLCASAAETLKPGSAPPDRGRLEAAANELGACFRAHLAFEEEELPRVFVVLDSWGPERVRDLHEEHARQRAKLDALVARLEADTTEAMAEALLELADELLHDMAEEEEGCLRAGLLGADMLTVERR